MTAVGGTNFALNSANQIQGETAWNDAPYDVSAGGGGSSFLFGRPGFQKGFARRHRALPDVSMLADVLPGYNIYCTALDCTSFGAGPWISVGGTSAASPLLAGGLALVDQQLRLHGRQNLGNSNSLLYRVARHFGSAGVFSDVRSGSDDLGQYLTPGKHRPLGCCQAGPGYDRASGLGSVNVFKLSAVAVSLAPRVARVGLALPGQRPIARHRLLARVNCTRRCNVSASAVITIQGARPVRVASRRFVFLRRGRQTLQLRFSRRQLRRLRHARHAHKRIYAHVVATVTDASGNVEARSRVHTLRIRR